MPEVLVLNPRNARGRFVKRRRKTNARRRRRNPVAALAANPRRRKRRHTNARRRRRNPIAALAANPRRRRRRRNPIAFANPRRRRRRYAANARRRVLRRNPSLRSMLSPRGLMHTLTPAVGGAAGALALDVALSYVPKEKLPSFLQTPWGSTGVKVLGAIVLGMAVGKFVNRRAGALAATGALTVTAYSVLKDFMAKNLPQVPVSGIDPPMGSDYSDTRLAYVNPAPMLQGRGMGAYMGRPTNAMPVGAYMRDSIDTVNSLHGYSDGL